MGIFYSVAQSEYGIYIVTGLIGIFTGMLTVVGEFVEKEKQNPSALTIFHMLSWSFFMSLLLSAFAVGIGLNSHIAFAAGGLAGLWGPKLIAVIAIIVIVNIEREFDLKLPENIKHSMMRAGNFHEQPIVEEIINNDE